jgi:hypothetical protein
MSKGYETALPTSSQFVLTKPNKPITTICHTKSPFVSGGFLADTSSVRNPHNQ